MSFQKIPKEKWFKLTKKEQDFHTLEYKEHQAKVQKIAIIVTRILAIFFIFVLFYIGYVQLEATKNYNAILDEYGNNGHCYLCGEKALKKCDCQYYTRYDYGNFDIGPPNITRFKEEFAEYNSEICEPFDIYMGKKISEISEDKLTFRK